jgi:hypothetical protein
MFSHKSDILITFIASMQRYQGGRQDKSLQFIAPHVLRRHGSIQRASWFVRL